MKVGIFKYYVPTTGTGTRTEREEDTTNARNEDTVFMHTSEVVAWKYNKNQEYY